jgi:hypothetical protein
MTALRRVLYLDALLTALSSISVLVAPGWLLDVLGQPPIGDEAWLRLLGVAGFVLALLMVLVAHRAEELWWWCWAFVIVEVGSAAVASLHLLLGLPDGTAAWPWWGLAGISWLFAGGFLWGIARAGTEAAPG